MKLSAREKLIGKRGGESVGACEAAPLRKQSHKKENQGEIETDEGKREKTAQIPDADV